MGVRVRPVEGRADLRRFIDLPYRLHRDEPNWVPPLRMEVRKALDPRRNPFFGHADTRLMLAQRDGQVVGRITAHVDHRHNERHGERTGMFGFFEAPDDPEVAGALVDAAKDWVREQGMQRMQGPYSWSMHEYVGALVDGFDTPPAIMMGHNPPYYDALLQGAGLAKAKDLYAFRFQAGGFPPHVQGLYDDLRDDPAVTVRNVDMRRFEQELRTVFEIYNEAWAENWGFVPIAEEEIHGIAKDLKMIVDPGLALIAEIEGEPVGMAIAVPNLPEAIHDLNGRLGPFQAAKLMWRLRRGLTSARLMLLGIRPQYRGMHSMAILIKLYGRLNENGMARGVEWGELSWTLEDNQKINESIRMTGAEHYKTYRIYGRPL